MHRKLIHSFHALGIVLSLATAGFIAAGPAPRATDAVIAHGMAIEPVTVSTKAKPGSSKTYSNQRRAQAREAMALPFFSFAQGLRSGNRS